jgi:putative Mg2+ transporter-C (MgtC) family protein
VNHPSNVELVIRLVVAVALGGMIGFERELRDHPAGLRTHITVSIGSALFVIAGAYGFNEFITSQQTNVVVGVDRVASTVVTGIGFLGGGAIIKHGASVRGLTTAGSLWVTSAVGLSVGLGSYVVAVAATVATIATLVTLRAPERWIARRLAQDRETVVIRMRPDADPSGVIAAVAELDDVTVRSLAVEEDAEGAQLEFSVVGRRGSDMGKLVAPLSKRDDVQSVEVI